MSPRVRAWVAAGAAAVAASVAFWLAKPPPEPIGAGQVAPAFELPRLDGGPPLSLDALRGRVVLLNFWATWCKPCEQEMPAMQRLATALAGSDFELVAVSVDQSADDVRAYRDRLGLHFPILLDPEKRVSSAYQSYRYPESYLIDRDGRILARYIGPRDWDSDAYRDRIRGLAAPGERH